MLNNNDILDNLSKREKLLLKKLIEYYIEDGQPVPSKLLAQCPEISLSSASIRNVLAELEKGGFLFSPHTSSGRIPTSQGLKLFLNTLVTLTPPAPTEVKKVYQKLQNNTSIESLIEDTSELLSGMTHFIGMVSLPKQQKQILKLVEFLPISKYKILVVFVLNEEDVQNRIIETNKAYSTSELEKASNYLTSNFAGKDLLIVRKLIFDKLQSVQQDLNHLMLAMMDITSTILDNQTENKDINMIMRGHNNAFSFIEDNDINNLKKLFEIFNHRQSLLHLLDKAILAEGIKIFIGEEAGIKGIDNCSVVTAPYLKDGQLVGMLGVIGPTRMPYNKIISIVEVTAKVLTVALNKKM